MVSSGLYKNMRSQFYPDLASLSLPKHQNQTLCKIRHSRSLPHLNKGHILQYFNTFYLQIIFLGEQTDMVLSSFTNSSATSKNILGVVIWRRFFERQGSSCPFNFMPQKALQNHLQNVFGNSGALNSSRCFFLYSKFI